MDCSTPGFPVYHQLLRVDSNSCPLSRWCHPTISSSVLPFSSSLLSFPASGSFPMSQFFASGGQSIGTSASVLPMNIQDWFPSGLTSLISLCSQGLSRVFSNTTIQKHQFFGTQAFFMVQLSHPRLTTGKTIALTIWSSVSNSDPKRWCCESAALNIPASLENSTVATGLEKVSFHSNPKERQCQRMLKVPHNCTHLTC